MKFNNIIFDFDGTLVDTKPGVIKTFQKIVEKLTSKQASEERIVRLIGIPLIPILKTLLDTNDETLIEKGIFLFKKYYNKEGVYRNSVYPGIDRMLKLLGKREYKLFVISNKIEIFINKILKQRNLRKYFTFIVGTNGIDLQHGKSGQVKNLLTNHKLKKQETIIVGDTENDIAAAKKNFIFSIGITWGYGSEDSLIKAGADKICHTPLELKHFIIENNGKRKTT